MQANVNTTTHAPSRRPTMPRMTAAAVPTFVDVPAAPKILDSLRNESGYRTLTVVLDIWAAIWAVVLALWWTNGPVAERGVALWTWVFVPILIVVLTTRSMYKRKLSHRFIDDFEPVETAVAVSALATLAVLIAVVPKLAEDVAPGQYVRPSEVGVKLWICAAVLVPGVRLLRSLAQRYLRRKFRFGSAALVVGNGPVAQQLITRMRETPDYGLRPVGVIDDTRPSDTDLLDVPYLGTTDNLENAVRTTKCEDLIIAPCALPDEQLALLAQRAQNLGMRVRVVPRLMDAVGVNARVEHLGGVPLMVLYRVDPRGLAVRRQARVRPQRRRSGPAAHLAAVPRAHARGPAELTRAGVLRAGTHRPRRQRVRMPEVPQHASRRPGRRRLRAPGRRRSRRRRGGGPAHPHRQAHAQDVTG